MLLEVRDYVCVHHVQKDELESSADEFVESIIKELCHKSGFRKVKFHDDDEEYDSQDDE